MSDANLAQKWIDPPEMRLWLFASVDKKMPEINLVIVTQRAAKGDYDGRYRATVRTTTRPASTQDASHARSDDFCRDKKRRGPWAKAQATLHWWRGPSVRRCPHYDSPLTGSWLICPGHPDCRRSVP